MHYPKLWVCFVAHIIICILSNTFSVRLSTCRQNEDSLTVSLNAPGESVLSLSRDLSLHCFIEKWRQREEKNRLWHHSQIWILYLRDPNYT